MSYDQLKAWEGPFGDLYTERNAYTDKEVKDGCLDLAARMSLWHQVLSHAQTTIQSAHELGCGTGANLLALNRLAPEMTLYGSEPNEKAYKLARKRVKATLDRDALPVIAAQPRSVQLAFTMGVLIHIPADALHAAMAEIYRISSKYIFCCEYFAPSEEERPYHGQKEMLWRRDYGTLWRNQFPVEFVAYGFCWKPVSGLDNVTWWLFEKKA